MATLPRPAAEAPNRAIMLALRSPIATVTALRRAAPAQSPTRHGQRAAAVPFTRMGKPNA
jgi:hypothetical protein